MRLRAVVLIILVLLALVVVAQNTEPTDVTFLFWTFTLSRILLLAILLGVGILIGLLLGRPWRRAKQYATIDKRGQEE